jgi:hypothetical protein
MATQPQELSFPVARSAVRNRQRALSAVVTAGIAVAVPAQIAYADSMEELTVAHRGASTSKLAEGTLPAYKYAVKNRADILDADVCWTKDGPRPWQLGNDGDLARRHARSNYKLQGERFVMAMVSNSG